MQILSVIEAQEPAGAEPVEGVMQLVLMSREKLIESAIAVDRNLAAMILTSLPSWHRDAALALLLQAANREAPVD